MSAGGEVMLSVVVPVLDEEDGLPELHRRLGAVLAGLDGPSEVVYVDDGSTDASAALVEGFAAAPAPGGPTSVVLVQLSRNFGMELAMSAGLEHARGRHVVLMHADLQDPPELIPEMLAAARDGADVVYARRIGRDESRTKRLLATAFYRLMERTARVPYQGQAGDFRLMSRRVVDTVLAMPERRRFLRGLVAWVGFEQVPVEYRRAGRYAGRGASYPQLVRLAVEAFTAFSDVPLALATILGMAIAAASALGSLLLLTLTVTGALDPSGTVWILAAVLLLGGVQLITVGILGRYLARVHEEVLARPLYLTRRVLRSEGPGPAAQPGDDERLERDVAGEPGQLGQLAPGVAQPPRRR